MLTHVTALRQIHLSHRKNVVSPSEDGARLRVLPLPKRARGRQLPEAAGA